MLNLTNSLDGISIWFPDCVRTVMLSGPYAFDLFVFVTHSVGIIRSWYPDALSASGRTQTYTQPNTKYSVAIARINSYSV